MNKIFTNRKRYFSSHNFKDKFNLFLTYLIENDATLLKILTSDIDKIFYKTELNNFREIFKKFINFLIFNNTSKTIDEKTLLKKLEEKIIEERKLMREFSQLLYYKSLLKLLMLSSKKIYMLDISIDDEQSISILKKLKIGPLTRIELINCLKSDSYKETEILAKVSILKQKKYIYQYGGKLRLKFKSKNIPKIYVS